MKRSAFAVLFAAAAVSPALADEAKSVEIKGVRNPELKTYRVMAAGLEAFDEYRSLAPAAPELRFRLRSRADAQADLEGLQLRVAGDNTSISVPIDGDLTFALPRSQAAADDNADLVLNKPKGRYRWAPDVHTPSVPPNMRRLGDLRLECQVLVAVGKQEMGFMLKAMVNSLLLTSDWCMHEKVHIGTHVQRQLSKAILLREGHRIALKLNDKGHGFEPPLSDRSYPDDALIALEYADASPAPTNSDTSLIH
jgi:hypothetical protein